jgi:serine/threonine-protein kinase
LQKDNPPAKSAWKHAVKIGVHVARALSFAHSQKLAHGNVTPPNILIRQADQVVRLGDLMLGKALEGSGLGRFARSQNLRFDLPYFSPEQAGAQPRVDALTDIYNLGACLYACCTGQPPVEGKTVEQITEQIP